MSCARGKYDSVIIDVRIRVVADAQSMVLVTEEGGDQEENRMVQHQVFAFCRDRESKRRMVCWHAWHALIKILNGIRATAKQPEGLRVAGRKRDCC